MQPPRFDNRVKVNLKTEEEFYDQKFGWVTRLDEPCPKCNRTNTMVQFTDECFRGCTHCCWAEPLKGWQFQNGGYTAARRILETINDQSRVEKPIQPIFHKMYMKRNGHSEG